MIPCHDPQQVSTGDLADLPPPTGTGGFWKSTDSERSLDRQGCIERSIKGSRQDQVDASTAGEDTLTPSVRLSSFDDRGERKTRDPHQRQTSVEVGSYQCERNTTRAYPPRHQNTQQGTCLREPKDLTENDDLCVKPLFFHRPRITSTYDSAESIATPPPESDLDDEQIRALLAPPLCLQEREASADRSQVYHSVREKLGVKFISSSEEYGERNPLRCFQAKRSQVKKHFPAEKIFPQNINRFLETTNSYSDSLIRKILSNHSWKNTDIPCLQKQNLKSRSKNVKWMLSTPAFVNFNDKLSLIGWNWMA